MPLLSFRNSDQTRLLSNGKGFLIGGGGGGSCTPVTGNQFQIGNGTTTSSTAPAYGLYDFSIYGGLEGKIVEISADSIKDKESKDDKSYYKVVIRTEKNYLEKNGIGIWQTSLLYQYQGQQVFNFLTMEFLNKSNMKLQNVYVRELEKRHL